MAICTGLFQLSCSPARSESEPSGLPVGGTIYFRKWLDPDGRLWSMNADGSDQRPMFETALDEISIGYDFVSERVISWAQ